MKEYPLFKVHIGNVDGALSRIRQVLESGFVNEGEQVNQLAEAMSRKLSADRLIMVNSCTSAITLALRLAGVDRGSNVVSTPMTCLATNCPIVNAGAGIIWADVDPNTGCISPDDLRKALAVPGFKVRAVVAVAWAGTPPVLDDLQLLCRSAKVSLILDAAHAMGATYRDKPIHHWADFTCYSLQAIKHITTGDGGILVTNDASSFARAKRLKWFGIDRDSAKDEKGNWRGQHWQEPVPEAGYKFNMNNLSAALGLEQVEHMDDVLAAHRSNASLYADLFAESREVQPLRAPTGSSHWVYTVRLKSSSPSHKSRVMQVLNAEGIRAGEVHVRNDTYECFDRFRTAPLPGVAVFAASQIGLPVGWWLKPDDIKHIAARVEAIAKETK
jgi:dTDP-4-amino-4,6-dideoxygalactose transaminase